MNSESLYQMSAICCRRFMVSQWRSPITLSALQPMLDETNNQ
ncbi:MAG TPA: hypothetical protein V6C64_04010 [Microcoleaceae cyanobacterium]